MDYHDAGAFTGEISPLMLTEIGVNYVIIGHSERREYYGEIDETVNAKIKSAFHHNLTPIVCVGESFQYGGSVKSENAREILGEPNIDGALVGGASLVVDEFIDIIKAANEVSA